MCVSYYISLFNVKINKQLKFYIFMYKINEINHLTVYQHVATYHVC